MQVRKLLIAVALLLIFPVISNAGQIQQKLIAESTVENIIKNKKMRVGMSTFVPWAMQDKSGKWIGFEIDVATRLAADMGVTLELIPSKWDGLIPSLLTGKFDVIIAGMSGTPERNLKINFTVPYDYAVQNLCANKTLAQGFAELEDFNRPDVTIIARLGTTAVETIKKLFPKAQSRQFPDEGSLVQELLNGKAHALVGDAPLPAFTALKYPDKIFAFSDALASKPICFGVRKGDADTLAYFNNWITNVSSEGWLKERSDYWFRTRDWKGMIE